MMELIFRRISADFGELSVVEERIDDDFNIDRIYLLWASWSLLIWSSLLSSRTCGTIQCSRNHTCVHIARQVTRGSRRWHGIGARRVFDRFSDLSFPSRKSTLDRPQFDVPCEHFQGASLFGIFDDTFQVEGGIIYINDNTISILLNYIELLNYRYFPFRCCSIPTLMFSSSI